ncbi:MAG: nucleotidyl transferase AbiEii/AbiGii toxin family protein [Actinobacteria bacterium]|nr:nucleotidyl transferase AbiEii/AbiGii toxin family protein [Actinomycetota bacterium]
MAAGRLRRWLGFMVVAAMLDEARHAEDGEPLFLVKGGVAMELRIDSGARATKDFDTAFRAGMEAVTDHLDPALRAGHGDFTATRTELEPVKDTGAARCEIKLAYRGSPRLPSTQTDTRSNPLTTLRSSHPAICCWTRPGQAPSDPGRKPAAVSTRASQARPAVPPTLLPIWSGNGGP